jgi:outer membrane protein, multidrug efflux system
MRSARSETLASADNENVGDVVRSESVLKTTQACLLALTVAGCALQPPAATPLPGSHAAWVNAAESVGVLAVPASSDTAWWNGLADTGLAALVAAAEEDSPTLGEALARIAEARANADAARAAASPLLSADASGSRGSTQSGSGAAATSSSATLNLSWELDLFGRLRHNTAAARQRLQASELDSASTRLSLQTDVADTVLLRRACALQLQASQDDVRSRQRVLELTLLRQSVGQVSPMDTARARSSLAEAQGNVATLKLQCAQNLQTLVALTGWPAERVQAALSEPAGRSEQWLPQPPKSALTLPASVLAQHPSVVSALRSPDAAYEDIGSAEAARRPSLSLSALLGSTWLRAADVTNRSTDWSLGPVASVTLWDAGSGRANADAARARHALALATLNTTLRNTVRDVENALSQLASAEQREAHAEGGEAAARELLTASEASFRAGRMSLFELEDARRSFNTAQSSHILARRDRAQAWVALVKSTGNALAFEAAAESPPASS